MNLKKNQTLGQFIITNINGDLKPLVEGLLNKYGTQVYDHINITKALAMISNEDLEQIIDEWRCEWHNPRQVNEYAETHASKTLSL